LEVDENFNVDKEQVKAMLELQKKKRDYLFKAPPPRIKDGNPQAPDLSPKPLSKLSSSELQEKLRQALSKQLK
jgi:hypothetical protein